MNEAEKLKKRIKELEEENKRLKEEKDRVEKEFEKYKAKYPATKELPAFVKEDIKTEKKTPGQKKGHKGYFRRIPERIDFIIPLEINCCPDCEGELSDTQEIRKRTIIEIPLTSQTINTQYEIHRKYCKKCDKIVEPDGSAIQ